MISPHALVRDGDWSCISVIIVTHLLLGQKSQAHESDWRRACRYATHVHEALTGLVGDPEQGVRRLMALQFHDICKMLGKERCAQYMKRY